MPWSGYWWNCRLLQEKPYWEGSGLLEGAIPGNNDDGDNDCGIPSTC